MANGWMVLSINLQKLLLDRVRAQGPEWVERVIAMERRMAGIEPERGLNYLKSKLAPLIEGPDGIAADCSRVIGEYADQHPGHRRSHARPHRPGRRALPVLPILGAAPPPRRQDAQRPGRPALSGRAARRDRALLHGRCSTPTTTTGLGSIPEGHRCSFATSSSRTSRATSRRSSTSTSRARRSSPAEVSRVHHHRRLAEGHPNHRRVPDGIHEQYVRLLTSIAAELDKPGGPELPNAWISGFYGSGKSSFAKLLGLALDGVALPDGRLARRGVAAARHVAEARTSFANAWRALRQKIDPLAVVFDIGGVARDNEHIHAAARAAGPAAARLLHRPSRSSPTSSCGSSATASGRASSERPPETLGAPVGRR